MIRRCRRSCGLRKSKLTSGDGLLSRTETASEFRWDTIADGDAGRPASPYIVCYKRDRRGDEMPAQFPITGYPRPGIVSIDTYYYLPDLQQATTMAAPGASVGFTVNVQSGFYLTSWRAYYANAYGDLIDVELTPTDLGAYSWRFTMPDSGVIILCEAEGSGGDIVWPPYQAPSTVNILSYATFDELVTKLRTDYGDMINESSRDYIEMIRTFVNNHSDYPYIELYLPAYPTPFDVTTSFSPMYAACYKIPLGEYISGTSVPFSYMVIFSWMTKGSSVLYVDAGFSVYNGNERPKFIGIGLSDSRKNAVMGCNALISEPEPVSSAITYILSPKDSGRVTGPDTYDGTSFIFEYRIKTAYELKRLTAFAVGEVSGTPPVAREEEIAGVTSVYDGESRTYSVTVSDIPDWAVGVRVVIETLYTLDPNDNGGESNTGGGNGTFDDSSDIVPVEPLPTISAADAGLITLFRPTVAQLKALGAYLWTNITDFIENIQKMFSNPMDVIIALNILPGLPPVGAERNIRLGLWETNVTMPPITSQWYEVDFGAIRIAEYWGSALDYAPNTKIHAMLPFIGSVQLDTDDVMGKTVGLLYRIDLLSGHLVAMITVDGNVLYQFTGECAVAVPLTGADWSRVYGAIAGTLGAAAFGAAGVASAGAGSEIAAAKANYVGADVAVAAGNAFNDSAVYAKGVSGVRTMREQMLQAGQLALDSGKAAASSGGRMSLALKAGVAAHSANNIVNQIMGGKVHFSHSGAISGSAGLLGNRRPYVYIEYPNQSLPENYKHFYGYPSNMYASLGSLSGYTQCYQVLLSGFGGTDGEQAELLEALKAGVYL